MNAADLTAVIGVVVAVIGTIVVPWALRRRKEKATAGKDIALSWASMNQALSDREARLQKRLDEIDADYIERIKTIRTDFEDQLQTERTRYEAELRAAQKRIAELEQEVAVLQRIVGGRP